MTVGAVGFIAFAASNAFFSDEETSTGNTFVAGAIDLKIDYDGYYNSAVDGDPDVEWDLTDLTTEKFFSYTDVKPGDFGEGTISMHVYNNDAWACVYIENMTSEDNDCTEPEAVAEGGTCDVEGELADNLYFTAWMDDGNNIWDEGEPLLFANQYGPASDVLNGKVYALADSTTGNGPLTGDQAYYIGIKWCAGAMSVIPETGVIACDGSTMNNASQTDSVTADLRFYVEQARNNPDFRCVPVDNERMTLTLENKDQNWNELTGDDVYGVLTYNSSGPTFDYDLEAHGLPASTNYDLIYYADPWPGNHPGALLGTYSTDASGDINETGLSYDFGYNLPNASDANSPTGAKLWLVPSSAYSVDQVVVWPFDATWLFEHNLITYTDTGA